MEGRGAWQPDAAHVEVKIKPVIRNLKTLEIEEGKYISDQVKVYGKFDWLYRLFIPPLPAEL